MPDGVAQTSDRTSGDTLISATAPATPRHAQRDRPATPFGSCVKDGPPWYACEHPQMSRRAPLWADRVFLWPTPRVPVSDSLRSLIDGARTVGASRVATGGLLELAYDVCSQSASITDVQAVRTCPVSDGFPVRERAAS